MAENELLEMAPLNVYPIVMKRALAERYILGHHEATSTNRYLGRLPRSRLSWQIITMHLNAQTMPIRVHPEGSITTAGGLIQI